MVLSHGCEKTISKLKPVFLNYVVSTGGFNLKPVFRNNGVSTGGFNCED